MGILLLWLSLGGVYYNIDFHQANEQFRLQTLMALTFGGARIAHTVCYSFALTWQRSVAYAVGLLAVLLPLISAVVAVFKHSPADDLDYDCIKYAHQAEQVRGEDTGSSPRVRGLCQSSMSRLCCAAVGRPGSQPLGRR